MQESVDKLQTLAQLHFWTSQTKSLLAQGTESLENTRHEGSCYSNVMKNNEKLRTYTHEVIREMEHS